MARILIAEDDVLCRRMLAATTEALGHSAVETADGAEAWDILCSNPEIDLVVTDMMMPNLNGRELIERLRARESTADLPVIIVSGYVGVNEISDLLAHGASRFIPKPVPVKLLEEYICKCLGQPAQLCRKAEELIA